MTIAEVQSMMTRKVEEQMICQDCVYDYTYVEWTYYANSGKRAVFRQTIGGWKMTNGDKVREKLKDNTMLAGLYVYQPETYRGGIRYWRATHVGKF